MAGDDIRIVLEPDDEYTHTPDEASNYNESMYLNAFDIERGHGGWFRLGNRVNEGYAEMTVCLYLADGRVGFTYKRPTIETNDEMRAGGLHIEVVEPFEHLRIAYDGRITLLDDPGAMADPRTAFAENPRVGCTVDLDVRGLSPMWGGRPVNADGSDIETDAERSFAKAHYEQHTTVTGTITIDEPDGRTPIVMEIDGYGLRDKSWGPRYWQAISWYRWLPMVFGDDLAMMLSIVDRPDGEPRRSGMVFDGERYHQVRDVQLTSTWNEAGEQTGMTAVATTDERTYEVKGEVISLIPLRNRRPSPDGEMLTTRITEAMTRYECDGKVGMGMSEYLDQVVDGRPIGPDVT